MKGWVGWPVADGLPTYWSPVSCRPSAGRSVLRPKTGVPPTVLWFQWHQAMLTSILHTRHPKYHCSAKTSLLTYWQECIPSKWKFFLPKMNSDWFQTHCVTAAVDDASDAWTLWYSTSAQWRSRFIQQSTIWHWHIHTNREPAYTNASLQSTIFVTHMMHVWYDACLIWCMFDTMHVWHDACLTRCMFDTMHVTRVGMMHVWHDACLTRCMFDTMHVTRLGMMHVWHDACLTWCMFDMMHVWCFITCFSLWLWKNFW